MVAWLVADFYRQAGGSLAMQTRINAHEITALLRNRAGSFGIRRCRVAGQPEIISGRIDNEPVRHKVRNNHGQVWRGREPGQPVQIGSDSFRRNEARIAERRIGLHRPSREPRPRSGTASTPRRIFRSRPRAPASRGQTPPQAVGHHPAAHPRPSPVPGSVTEKRAGHLRSTAPNAASAPNTRRDDHQRSSEIIPAARMYRVVKPQPIHGEHGYHDHGGIEICSVRRQPRQAPAR